MSGLLTQLIVLSLLTLSLIQKSAGSDFLLKYVRLCLKPEFLYEPAVAAGSDIFCAVACTARGDRCQGYRLIGDIGRCQTFEFDRCSHMVNAAGCSQFGWAYVRKQPGLPDGQLCPDGYGSGYYGSTYKLISASDWMAGLTYCSSEPGLTKYADAMDGPEALHMYWIKDNVPNANSSYFVGGCRTSTNSTRWFWHACNVTFLPEVWEPGQPNDPANAMYTDIWATYTSGLGDTIPTWPGLVHALCECVNPFV